jgi:hypothetical protein
MLKNKLKESEKKTTIILQQNVNLKKGKPEKRDAAGIRQKKS